jgi:bifunctional oligoribonuclease and PAP phosphatase NrnA
MEADQVTSLPGPPSAADWTTVVDLLRSAKQVVLAGHVSPDGDALGSALAVGLALRSLGVEVAVSFGDDPFVVPGALSCLPGQDLLVPPGQVPEAPDVLMVFDTGSADRLGLLRPLLGRAGTVVVVDHHASNTGFGAYNLVDSAAAATAVLAEELIRQLDAKLSPDIAAALYAGLVTDTGSFRFASTTPHTHHLAARLLSTGIRHDLISRQLLDTASFDYLKVLASALGRAELEPAAAGGLGLVWTVVTGADRARHGVSMDEIDGVIDILRRTEQAEVAVVLKERPDGGFAVSVRSRGAVDVSRVCGALGGGGHRCAAGFTAHGDLGSTLAALRSRLAGQPLVP